MPDLRQWIVTQPEDHPWILSFQGRPGRMRPARQAAWDSVGDLLLPAAPWQWDDRPVTLDIGCGMGHSVIALAEQEPDSLVVGIDVHVPGLARIVQHAQTEHHDNIRVWCGDALTALADYVPPSSIDRITVWFPDPWPKRTQKKRRLVRPLFADLIARTLVPEGRLYLATDDANYAAQMRTVLNGCTGLREVSEPGRPDWRPITKYERKATTPITDLAYAAS